MKRILIIFAVMLTAMSVAAQSINVGDFTKIEAEGWYKITVTKGDKCGVQLDVSDDMAKYVDIYVNESELHIGLRDKAKRHKDSYMNVSVCLPNLEEIEASGSCAVEMVGKFNITGREFKIDLEGASSLNVSDLDAGKCSVELSGAAGVKMTGNFSMFELDMDGSSKAELAAATKSLDCEVKGASKFSGIKAKTANVELEGASNGELEVTDFMNVKLEGACKLYYSGPETLRINKQISFPSKLEKK